MKNIYKIILQVYILTACFISSMILMVVCAFIANNINKLIFFNYKYRNKLEKYESNQQFIKRSKIKHKNTLTPKRLTELRLNERKKIVETLCYDIYNNLIDCIPWFVVSFLFFCFHFFIFRYLTKLFGCISLD